MIAFQAACQASGVRVLVQTSSSNVCVDPTLAGHSLPESSPYTTRATCQNHYGWTKALAEKQILDANSESLATAAVRPCSLIFGYKDRFSMERFLASNKIVSINPDAEQDVVYIDNVVYAHLLAEAKLLAKAPGVGGQAFNITNERPLHMEAMHKLVVKHRPSVTVSYGPPNLLFAMAYVVEFLQWISGGQLASGGDLGMLTPPALTTAMMSYTFSAEKAKRYLGYRPLFTVEQGIRRTVQLHIEHTSEARRSGTGSGTPAEKKLL